MEKIWNTNNKFIQAGKDFLKDYWSESKNKTVKSVNPTQEEQNQLKKQKLCIFSLWPPNLFKKNNM